MKLFPITKIGFLTMVVCPGGVLAQPFIQSLSSDGVLVWTNNVTGNVSVIEKAATLTPGMWEPVFYDWATNGLYSTPLPASDEEQAFYRVAVATNIADTSLVLHLSFDNDFPQGTVLDVSGYGNHGLRYGRPCCPTNWPAVTEGPDGSQAAEFHHYWDGYGLYGRSGDYIGIPRSAQHTNLTQATVCAWAYYYTAANGEIVNDHNSTIMNSGKDYSGTWFLGREYANFTSFLVTVGVQNVAEPIQFPDVSPDGNSGGWHHYVVTFDGGAVKGYYDGQPFTPNGEAIVPVASLTVAGHYLGISCWTFNVTPELDLTVDGHPNNAWVNGALDDLRIYNRVLSPSEISGLYDSYNKLPPTVPTGLTAVSPSSSQVQLYWQASTDKYGVAGYVVSRDGVVVSDQSATYFLDNGLLPGTSHNYTIAAYDYAGNHSAESPATNILTRPVGSGVDFIVDDADGQPFVVDTGDWPRFASAQYFQGYNAIGSASDDNLNKGSLTQQYTPVLPESGDYNVYMKYPGNAGRAYLVAGSVPVDIIHGGVTNTVFVNQKVNFAQWFPLGQYTFDAGTNGSVIIRNAGTTGIVFGDAFRFVK